MMVGIDQMGFSKTFDNDLEVVEALVTQQSVFCLPGKCFNIPNFFRIVLTTPAPLIIEACDRIAEFCHEHYDFRVRLLESQQSRPSRAIMEASLSSSSGFSNGSEDEFDDDKDIEKDQQFSKNVATLLSFGEECGIRRLRSKSIRSMSLI